MISLTLRIHTARDPQTWDDVTTPQWLLYIVWRCHDFLRRMATHTRARIRSVKGLSPLSGTPVACTGPIMASTLSTVQAAAAGAVPSTGESAIGCDVSLLPLLRVGCYTPSPRAWLCAKSVNSYCACLSIASCGVISS